MDDVLACSAGHFEHKTLRRQILAEDFCYGFAVASPSSRYTSDTSFVICALTPQALQNRYATLRACPVRQFFSGTEADPQVSLLSRLLGHDESVVRNALIVAAALLVELGSGLGLYLATGHSLRGSTGSVGDRGFANEKRKDIEEMKRKIGDIEDWCLARLQPAGAGSLSLVELFGDYVAWCTERGQQPTPQVDFEAEFGDIATEIGLVKDANRYAGIRLGGEEFDAYLHQYRASA